MAIPIIAAGIGAVASIVGGIIQSGNAKRQARAAERERQRINNQIAAFESNRQAVINPYSGVTSLADMATDLSGDLTNPYANLGVATSAAEIKMEQTDIALANTLDALQATGASAGGATALAQAAARSKKDVAAGIEAQEAQNEKLEAQGAARLQEQQMSEKQRIQGIQISEGGRAQNAQAQGAAFQFGAQENRDMATLDRMQAGVDQANVNQANANASQQAAIGSIIGGVSNMASSALQAGAFNSTNSGNNNTASGSSGELFASMSENNTGGFVPMDQRN
tara:strand:+ start:292 stop:1134 length:843 start_codon:yes stop_codon:yes gene_type:complete